MKLNAVLARKKKKEYDKYLCGQHFRSNIYSPYIHMIKNWGICIIFIKDTNKHKIVVNRQQKNCVLYKALFMITVWSYPLCGSLLGSQGCDLISNRNYLQRYYFCWFFGVFYTKHGPQPFICTWENSNRWFLNCFFIFSALCYPVLSPEFCLKAPLKATFPVLL